MGGGARLRLRAPAWGYVTQFAGGGDDLGLSIGMKRLEAVKGARHRRDGGLGHTRRNVGVSWPRPLLPSCFAAREIASSAVSTIAFAADWVM